MFGCRHRSNGLVFEMFLGLGCDRALINMKVGNAYMDAFHRGWERCRHPLTTSVVFGFGCVRINVLLSASFMRLRFRHVAGLGPPCIK